MVPSWYVKSLVASPEASKAVSVLDLSFLEVHRYDPVAFVGGVNEPAQ